jgi:hypothetical protein
MSFEVFGELIISLPPNLSGDSKLLSYCVQKRQAFYSLTRERKVWSIEKDSPSTCSGLSAGRKTRNSFDPFDPFDRLRTGKLRAGRH